MDNLAGVVQYNGHFETTIETVCHIMTDQTKGTPLERLADLNTLMLEGEECLDHRFYCGYNLSKYCHWPVSMMMRASQLARYWTNSRVPFS